MRAVPTPTVWRRSPLNPPESNEVSSGGAGKRGEPVMKTVRNKTPMPIRVQLGGGKTLFLGPAKSGQISDGAAERDSSSVSPGAGRGN